MNLRGISRKSTTNGSKRSRPRKKKSTAKLKKDLWKIFSLYIRQRDKGICFTCGEKGFYGYNYHAGHFLKKSICGLILYFHEDNVHGQCARCNLWLDGDQYNYGIRLGDKAKELMALLPKSRKAIWTREDYLAKIAHYKALIK